MKNIDEQFFKKIFFICPWPILTAYLVCGTVENDTLFYERGDIEFTLLYTLRSNIMCRRKDLIIVFSKRKQNNMGKVNKVIKRITEKDTLDKEEEQTVFKKLLTQSK